MISLIAMMGKEKLEQQQRKLLASPPCYQAFATKSPGGSRGKAPLFISPVRAKHSHAVLLGTRCSSSSELSSSEAGSSPQPWGSTGCCTQESHQKQGKTTLPQPGLRQPRWRGSCCSRASLCLGAGSIPCLHRKWATPSTGQEKKIKK